MTAARQPRVRFDDLVSGRSRTFRPVVEELVAERPEDVLPLLRRVEEVTERGQWAFGFVSYEAAPAVDASLTTREPAAGVPLAWFGVSPGPTPAPPLVPDPRPDVSDPQWICDWDAARHACAVAAVHDHIAAGDTYQCNLTSRLRAGAITDPRGLYADLALAQRGRYNAYLDLGDLVVASASPELFFEWTEDRVVMRPMKGTAPRGLTADADVEAVQGLMTSPKERAENLMIVDLVRNDLARVAVTGTVEVTSLFTAEHYETVHQLTSEVTAVPRPGTTLTDLFRALFPCGSVTGAPKARTMQIISELEDSPRGVYCGAIGMVAPRGQPFRARFSVAIRTLLLDRRTRTAVYGSGGGITWDSVAGAEYDEMLTKARVLQAGLARGPVSVAAGLRRRSR